MCPLKWGNPTAQTPSGRGRKKRGALQAGYARLQSPTKKVPLPPAQRGGKHTIENKSSILRRLTDTNESYWPKPGKLLGQESPTYKAFRLCRPPGAIRSAGERCQSIAEVPGGNLVLPRSLWAPTYRIRGVQAAMRCHASPRGRAGIGSSASRGINGILSHSPLDRLQAGRHLRDCG